MATAIRDSIGKTTGEELVGLYLYGSLATGDFEPHISDIDLIAVLVDVPDEPLVARLREMHDRLVRANLDWGDRVEVDYVSARGLAECRTRTTTIARISPGEPLHLVDAGRDFLLDWYPAREDAIALIGPPIDAVIPDIPEAEYLDEVRSYLAGFLDRFDDDASLGSQSYAILTMCRGLYALRFGQRLSKREAAMRTRGEFPRWAPVIDRAIAWRDAPSHDGGEDGLATVEEARSFLTEVARLLDLDHAE
jgi:Domain of unknown function (DUF4111)/Nucleotidyltransferase domain